ncbi:MAG TPA: sigma 54-interacting transcriptional regulator [Polyangiaceae bacterium]|nr:sigma 54-interacting transcriptional regulator [Polyangiaceae bacterium]
MSASRFLVVSHGDRARVVPLPESGQVTLGRGDDCFVQINHDALVSRRHLTLHLGPEIFVEDLGSQNGTRVLGGLPDVDAEAQTASSPARLEPGRPARLPAGAKVQIGSTVVAYHEATADGEAAAPPPGGDIVVADPRMRYLHELLARVAARTINVLLLGETGVGKDVFARRIHALSPRAAAPFLGINCGALSESLLESELFGHEKGAFTGAHAAKRGLFEAASGGVAFLDEAGELSPGLQVKLLRVLEDRTVMRVGSVRPTPIDVRVLSATNRDLDREVAAGRYRSDLYFRLNGISIVIPPLRERPAEIVPLAALWLRRFCEREGRARVPVLSEEAAQRLRAYSWPGNVRELRNVIERSLVLCDGPIVRPEHVLLSPTLLPEVAAPAGAPEAPAVAPPRPTLSPGAPDAAGAGGVPPIPPLGPPPAAAAPIASAASAPPPGAGEPMSPEALRSQADALERERLREALTACGGNQTRAAAMLGISRRALIMRLERFKLPRPKKGPEGA